MQKKNIKLVLEYDGQSFYGFQRQPKHRSIQSELEKALSRLFNQPLKISAASGRTDTGVHALGQVVNFKVATVLPCTKIQKGLNALLPKAISIRKVQLVANDFHARYDATSKTYAYQIWNSGIRSPLKDARMWQVPQSLNISAMKSAAKYLKGRHDFKSFCASGGSQKSTVRKVNTLSIVREKGVVTVRVAANGFLYHMVRNIVGTLVEVGKGNLAHEDVKKVLKAKDRKRAAMTAPAHALTLVSVKY